MVMVEPTRTPDPSRPVPPTVVLVDDDEQVLSALRRAFRHEPYRVLATVDPYEAWSWIRSRPVDLVIADEFMPSVMGTDLLEAARRARPRSASIVLTGYPQTTVGSRVAAKHIDLLLFKPWKDDELRDSVRRLLDDREGSRPPGPSPEALS
jgi:response regulator RpfG family c-di-GMP phosphodiesterase